MKNFVVDQEFWLLFPDAKIGVIQCRGINNTIKDMEKYARMLRKSEAECLSHLQDEEFSGNPVIKVWREAFQKFKTKKGARSSVEALLKRVQNGNQIGSINPLVDIYNAISLKYGLPCGGEDLNAIIGEMRLTLAAGDEEFIPLGAEEDAPPYKGEVIYKDEKGAVCRCWNWRESKRTMLTGTTKDAFLCIESVDVSRKAEFEEALKELSERVKENLGGSCQVEIFGMDSK